MATLALTRRQDGPDRTRKGLSCQEYSHLPCALHPLPRAAGIIWIVTLRCRRAHTASKLTLQASKQHPYSCRVASAVYGKISCPLSAEGSSSKSCCSIPAVWGFLQDRPKPSLHARSFLRLGLFQWHHQEGGQSGSLAGEAQLSSCMELMRVRGWGWGWRAADVNCCLLHRWPESWSPLQQCSHCLVLHGTVL